METLSPKFIGSPLPVLLIWDISERGDHMKFFEKKTLSDPPDPLITIAIVV